MCRVVDRNGQHMPSRGFTGEGATSMEPSKVKYIFIEDVESGLLCPMWLYEFEPTKRAILS